MKQIPLLQGKALLVEMPNLKLITTIHKGLLVAGVNQKDVSSKCIKIDRGDVKGFLQLPPGNWRIIGMLSEVTEEQAAEIVDGDRIPFDETQGAYRDYTYKSNWGAAWLSSALESLDSAIEAAAYTFSNPYGEVEPKYDGYNYNYGFAYESPTEKKRFERDFNDWQAAQSRVLCRERCLLLGREI